MLARTTDSIDWSRPDLSVPNLDSSGFIIPNEPILRRALEIADQLSPEGVSIHIGGPRCFDEICQPHERPGWILLDRYAPTISTGLAFLEAGVSLKDQGQLSVAKCLIISRL